MTEEVLCAAIQKGSSGFKLIPKEKLTEKICIEAVKHCSRNDIPIKDIPEQMLTETVCLEAVKHEPFALGDIPPEKITEEMVLIAVKGSYTTALYIPDRLKTPEFLETVIATESRAGRYL